MFFSGLVRIGREPEMRTLASGESVLSLALVYQHGKKANGEKYRPSQWIDTAIFGKHAESLQPYLKKGAMINILMEDPVPASYNGQNGLSLTMKGKTLKIELVGNFEENGQQNNHSSPPPPPPQKGNTNHALNNLPDDEIPF